MVRFRHCLLGYAFLCAFGISGDASSSLLSDWAYDLSDPGRVYSPSGVSEFYYDATSACIARSPGTYEVGQATITYSNPRAGWHETYGFGCYYHVTSRWTSTGVVYNENPDWFGQNWVGPYYICPLGSSLNNGKCQKIRYPEHGVCDRVGNPVSPGREFKAQVETDYQSAAVHSPLFFVRQFSSWHFKPYSNTLGQNWFIQVFGRYLTLDSSFIVATRALGDTKAFDLNQGNWEARTVTADFLQEHADGNGSAW